MYHYKTSGVCSSAIHFELSDGKIHSVSFDGGCDGNLQAVSTLVEGMDAAEVIKKLKGLQCGRKRTSCPDQLAAAVASATAQSA